MLSFLQRCSQYAWHTEVIKTEPVGAAPTMLSHGEQLMLHWLAREITERGCIVDAGCFLGGSTLALATGLARRPMGSSKMIHSYDIFTVPQNHYYRELIGRGRKSGDTSLDLFLSNTTDYRKNLFIHAGDLMEASAPPEEISILFVDVAKSRDLNSKLLREFFPKLIPGSSIVIQQDHNDHSCPWVNASMACLADYFTVMADEGSSRVYLNTQRVPEDMLVRAGSLDPAEEIETISAVLAYEQHPFARFFSAVTAAWSVFEIDGLEAGLSYLSQIEIEQPWTSGEPYVEFVKREMTGAGNHARLRSIERNFFSPEAA